jgi:hypothetical protein
VDSTRKKLDALIALMKEITAEFVVIDWNLLPPIETETNDMEEAPTKASKLEDELTDEQEESSREVVIALGMKDFLIH